MAENSILIKNIYYMLAYAFQILNQGAYEDMATEEFENAHDLFAAILSNGISYQLKQGLYKSYIPYEENLTTVKGKININETIKNQMAKKQMIYCEFDEFSENNIYNQIIKTTANLLLKSNDVSSKYRASLKKVLLFFENVDTVNLSLIRWDTIRFSRNNQNYRILLSVCRLLIEGMLFTTESGDQKLAEFFDEQRMCALYEKFILEYYKKEFPKLYVDAPEIKWQLDDDNDYLLPKMLSDIVIKSGGKTLIIDAKYYQKNLSNYFSKETVISNNLYQIFAYVKNQDVGNTGNVSGLLLYAKTDAEVQPKSTYMMSGNSIGVDNLDLNCDFVFIKNQLNSILYKYFDLR